MLQGPGVYIMSKNSNCSVAELNCSGAKKWFFIPYPRYQSSGVTIQKFCFCPLKLCFSIKTIGIDYYSRVGFDGMGRVCFYGFGRHSINSANCVRLLANTTVSFIPTFFQLNNKYLLIKIGCRNNLADSRDTSPKTFFMLQG